MILITSEEKEEIRKKLPDVPITRTMKQDSHRHHYYMAEERSAMSLLRRIRGNRKGGEKQC